MLDLKILKLHPESLRDFEVSRNSIKKIADGNPSLTSSFGFFVAVKALQEILNDKSKIYPTLGDKVSEFLPSLAGIVRKYTPAALQEKIPFAETVAYVFSQDPVFGEVVTTVAAAQADPNAKYYYMASNFWRKFQHVNIDSLRFRDLYRGGSGYIYFPESITDEEGTEYQHFYFVSGNINDYFGANKHRFHAEHAMSSNILMVALLSDNGPNRIMGVQFPQNEDLKPKDFFAGAKEAIVQMENPADLELGISTYETGYTPLTSKIFNVMAYIGTGEPDIRVFQNNLRYRTPHSKTPVRADSNLSVQPINIVGYSWLKEKNSSYQAEGWRVRAHLRWQRCGEGYSKVKLITVKEHEKHWKDSTIDSSELIG